eukprot:gene15097-biopygen11194
MMAYNVSLWSQIHVQRIFTTRLYLPRMRFLGENAASRRDVNRRARAGTDANDTGGSRECL